MARGLDQRSLITGFDRGKGWTTASSKARLCQYHGSDGTIGFYSRMQLKLWRKFGRTWHARIQGRARISSRRAVTSIGLQSPTVHQDSYQESQDFRWTVRAECGTCFKVMRNCRTPSDSSDPGKTSPLSCRRTRPWQHPLTWLVWWALHQTQVGYRDWPLNTESGLDLPWFCEDEELFTVFFEGFKL